MKLFIKEHRILVIVQMVQAILLMMILWLDGYKHVVLTLYIVFLNFFILFFYLIYRYITHRHFYNKLSKPLLHLEDSLQHMDQSSLSTALNTLLKTQYEHYKNQLLQSERKQEEYLIFMDRWIHQMKTPLSVLQLMAQDLDEPDSSNFREELERMKTGLQMVLHMARLRTVEQDFHIKRVHLLSVIREVNQENKRNFIRNGIYPQIIEEKKDLLVETDEKWLFFMLTQIIHNAVKYSAGRATQINILLSENDGHIIVDITDFGVGIPTEDLKRIFDAFYTGENGREFRESTGVGLFLVKEVANYLGHQLEVKSEVGVGSTFRILF